MYSETFNNQFTRYLQDENRRKEQAHISSGKVSPSKIAKPTLNAVLSLLGVPQDPPNDQGLRYFFRGNALEEVAVKAIADHRTAYELQREVSYRGGIGIIDLYQYGPHEIKSAGRGTWAITTSDSLRHHALQATFYALGTGDSSAWLHYINADTLQLRSFKIYAAKYQAELDRRIDAIYTAIRTKQLPNFIPLEKFDTNPKYSNYPKFHNMKGVDAEKILQALYPEQYELLKSGELIERLGL